MSENKNNNEKYNKYSNSKLYKIISRKSPEKIYYGITTDELRKILSSYKTKYKKYVIDNNIAYNPSFELIKNDDAEIILVKKFKCDDIDEYHKYLYDYINDKENPNINYYIPEGYKPPIRKRLYYEKMFNTVTETNKTETETEIKKGKEEIKTIKKELENIKRETESINNMMRNYKEQTKLLEYKEEDKIKLLEYKEEDKIKILENNASPNINKDIKENKEMINNLYKLEFKNNTISDNVRTRQKEIKTNDYDFTESKENLKGVRSFNISPFEKIGDNINEYDGDIYTDYYYIINNKKYDIEDNKYIIIDNIKIEKDTIDKYDLKKRKDKIKQLEKTIKQAKEIIPDEDGIKPVKKNKKK